MDSSQAQQPKPKKTREDLIAAGYKHEGSSRCNGCGAEMEWWLTPKGKRMPVDPGTGESHFATCPKAAQFRR